MKNLIQSFRCNVRSVGAMLLLACRVLSSQAVSSVPFYEPFSTNRYTDGQALGTEVPQIWDGGNGTSVNLPVNSASTLSYSGLLTEAGSYGLGITTSTGRNRSASLVAQTTTTYASFLLNVATLPAGNRFIFSLGTGTSSSAGAAIAINPAGQLWVSKTNTVSGIPVTLDGTGAAALALNTTYLVVMRYKFNPSASDDEVALWVNPSSLGVSEGSIPAATISNTTGTDRTSFQSVSYLCNSSASPMTGKIDEIRVGSTWASVTPQQCQVPTASAPASLIQFENLDATINATVGGSDNGAAPAKQWQVSVNSGSTWNNIADATNTSYTLASAQLADSGKQYRIIATTVCSSTSVTSTPPTILTVNTCLDIAITSQPTNTTTGSGQAATFNVAANGSLRIYQWQISTDTGSTWNNVTTGTSGSNATYTTPILSFLGGDSGQQFRVVISNRCDSTFAISQVATSTVVCLTATIVTPPVNRAAVEGNTCTFSITGGGSFPTYQWLTNGVPVSGETSTNYTTPILTLADNGLVVQCVVTAPCDNLSVTSAPVTATIGLGNAASFRSIASGSWGGTGTWEVSFNNGSTWTPTSTPPDSANNTNTVVRSPHVVTISTARSIDQATIQAGATVDIVSAGSLTISDDTGTDLDVSGILKSAGPITTTGTLVFKSGGKYQHNYTGASGDNLGTIPTATWSSGSTCEIIGFTSGFTSKIMWSANSPTSLSQSFYNFTWNCPSQASTICLGNDFTCAGDFTFIGGAASSSGVLGLGENAVTVTPHTVTIGGNLTVTGGPAKLVPTSAAGNVETIRIGGNFVISGATAQFDGFGNSETTLEFNGMGNQIYTNGGIFSTADTLSWKVDSGTTFVPDTTISVGQSSGTTRNNKKLIVDGTLDLNGLAIATTVLEGSGIITNSGSTSVTITVGKTATTTNSLYNGVITGNGVGTIALSKSGPTTTLSLLEANSYNGGTTVSEGVLSVQKDGGLGGGNVTVASGATLQLTNGVANKYLADAATLNLVTGSVVDLGYTGAADTINSLVIDSAVQADGIWGSATSGAANQQAVFTGSGTLNVHNVVVSNQPPVISSTTVSAGSLVISGSGTANGSYYVLSATNITLPLSNWTYLATNAIDGAGNFSFTNAIAPGQPKQFYRLLVP